MSKLLLTGSLAADLSGVLFGLWETTRGESTALTVMSWTSISIGLVWGAAASLHSLFIAPVSEG